MKVPFTGMEEMQIKVKVYIKQLKKVDESAY